MIRRAGVLTGVLLVAWAMQVRGDETASTQPLPTQAEIQAAFDAGNYDETLRKVGRVLPVLGSKRDYDAFVIQTLKAESYLQLKNAGSAAAGFGDAEKAAPAKVDGAKAAAMRILIQKRTPEFAYVPVTGKFRDTAGDATGISSGKKAKSGKAKPAGKGADPSGGVAKTPISLLDRSLRDKAFAALYADEFDTARTRQSALLKDKALPPIVDFAPRLKELRKLALAATGSDADVLAMQQDLSAHAANAISDTLADMGRQVDQISRNANETVDRVVDAPDPKNPKKTIKKHESHKRGLTTKDTSTLNEIVATCDKIPAMCKDLGEALGMSHGALAAQAKAAGDLEKKAAGVLGADYTKGTHRKGQ